MVFVRLAMVKELNTAMVHFQQELIESVMDKVVMTATTKVLKVIEELLTIMSVEAVLVVEKAKKLLN